MSEMLIFFTTQTYYSEYKATIRQLYQMLLNARSNDDINRIKIEIEKVIHEFDQKRWQGPFPGAGKGSS